MHFSSRLHGHGAVYAMIFLYAFQFTVTRARGHGTVYAMIILYSFQFSVTQARHYICHDISSCISVYDYASTLKPQKYMLWYFFIRFSSRLRGHGTIYAMILLCAFQFTITRARGHGDVYRTRQNLKQTY